MGDQHIEIIMERMARKFGVEAVLKAPTIEYRETIRSSAEVEGKHKKQSGGHGQYGHVVIKMEPLPPGGGFEFVDKILAVRYQDNISQRLKKVCVSQWNMVFLAGYPVVDVRVTLLDGSYHTVDSSEMAFKIASHEAFKKSGRKVRPCTHGTIL